MPFARTEDGAQIHYEAYGEGPGLLLIPGIGCSSEVWGPFPRALGHYFRTLAYDPRGLGRSTLPEGYDARELGVARMAADAAAVAGAAGFGRVHVLGMSLGGIVAQYLASEREDSVDRLVLVSTADRLDRWTSRMLSVFEILATRLTPEEYATVLAPLVVSPGYFRSEPKRTADLEGKLAFAPEALPVFRAQVRALAELADRRPRVRRPTLILAGRHDWVTPLFCSEAIHARIEGSRLRVLEAGHSCLMERVEEGLVALLGFLRAEPGPTEEDA